MNFLVKRDCWTYLVEEDNWSAFIFKISEIKLDQKQEDVKEVYFYGLVDRRSERFTGQRLTERKTFFFLVKKIIEVVWLKNTIG